MLRACAGPCLLISLGAGVVGRFYFGDGFKDPVILNEGTAARGPPLVAMLLHPSRFETKERVEKIVRIATQQRAGQTNNSISTRCQRTQRISLRGIAR